MESEIKAEFENNGFSLEDEEEILSKCLTFCINYKLSASDLVSSWEIYYLNRHLNGSVVKKVHMDGFLSHLQKEQLESIMKEEPNLHFYSSNDVDMLLSDTDNIKQLGLVETPSKQYEPLSLTFDTDEKPSSLVHRSDHFLVHSDFNSLKKDDNVEERDPENSEDEIIRKVQPGPRCSVQALQSQPKPGCKFMCDRTADRFNSLENRIRRHTAALVASGLYGEPADPSLASQKSIFVVGMICCDGEGHLNEKSALLQGSVEHSAGQRVRLDLQNLDHFSLFPGQVIGIEGHNPSGHCLIASKVVDSLPLPTSMDEGLPPLKKQAMDMEFKPLSPCSSSTSLSLVIAAGPFTTTDNLFFEPLAELLAYSRRKQPQVLLLLGPFVDSEHPELKKGSVERSFDEIFHVEVVRRLQDYLEYMGSTTQIVLVPSIRDCNHDFVFPQPFFDIQLPEDLKHQILCAPNPGVFKVNEITVGGCSIDILKQLSSEEIWKMPPGSSHGDRVGRLAMHLLHQRSYYPLYPPSKGVPLDLSLAPEALQIRDIPDFLVLPSDLAPFIKVLSLGETEDASEGVRCICLNPGRLAKGIGGGTFIELNYHGEIAKTNASIIRI
ncbi:hypothetical protein H6P81_012763 [Aristolochia fimbriata]|uniref:DNA polymerase alpha subunit B n=1 Tax=Aristolochia fimbriata TaxID=158543 RepID=A0AAV7EEW9_ARIFI|nr:hypothetical protein H6P81_012763 [Aristolochia fimbriata]